MRAREQLADRVREFDLPDPREQIAGALAARLEVVLGEPSRAPGA